MENNVNLSDVRSEAMDIIRRLKSKEIEVKTAKEIKGLLDTIVETAKTQVEFLKVLPEEIKYDLKATGMKAIATTIDEKNTPEELPSKAVIKEKVQVEATQEKTSEESIDATISMIEYNRNHYRPEEKRKIS